MKKLSKMKESFNKKKKEKMTFAKNNKQAILAVVIFLTFISKVSYTAYYYFINGDELARMNVVLAYVLGLIIMAVGLSYGVKVCLENAKAESDFMQAA